MESCLPPDNAVFPAQHSTTAVGSCLDQYDNRAGDCDGDGGGENDGDGSCDSDADCDGSWDVDCDGDGS